MFLERKIMGRLHGEATRQFSAILGLKELEKEISFFGKDNPLTKLCPKLEGVNPDDAFSTVPYGRSYSTSFTDFGQKRVSIFCTTWSNFWAVQMFLNHT